MFVIGYFLQAVARILDSILWFYLVVIIARALISWVNPDPYNTIVRVLYSITEPVLSAIRRILPRFLWDTGIDFSPFVAILMIYFIRDFLVRVLLTIAGYLL